METTVLGDSIMLLDLDLQGFSNSALVPVWYTADKFALIPQNLMLMRMGMMNDSRLIPLVSSAMGLVFFQPGGEGTACLSDVHLTTFTWNAVNSREVPRMVLVFVSGED